MDLIESVRVSLFLGRISGVCPITVNGPKFQRHITISKFYLLWSVFIIILQLFVFYFSVSKPYDSTLLAFIYTFNNFNTNLSQIIITICLLLKRDCLIDILEKLNKYSDVNLKKIFILITFIGPLFCIFIFTIYFVNTLITWNKYGSDLYTIEEITFEIVLILYELILFEIVTFYVSLIYFIYLNLKRLNDEFEMFQELNGTSIKRIRHVPNEITKFSSRFFYLRELADQVSYLFSILALLSISLNFVFIVAILFVIISEYFRGNDKEGNLSLLLSWVFYLVTKSVLICGVPSLVSDEGDRTAILIHKHLLTAKSLGIREELNFFSLQLLQRNFKFSACGFFNLDLALLYKMVGGIATYLVILIQFKEPGNHQTNNNVINITDNTSISCNQTLLN